jgi:transcriptional regulator with XRE-family HTH domain
MNKAISRAIGMEIRSAREARSLSRQQLASLLPYDISVRTLLSYEHGLRNLSVVRLIEIGQVLGVDARIILARSLQRAQLDPMKLALVVDLNKMIKDESPAYRPMRQWARNTLNEKTNNGVVDMPPNVVRHLAHCIGYKHEQLAQYLSKFGPDYGLED